MSLRGPAPGSSANSPTPATSDHTRRRFLQLTGATAAAVGLNGFLGTSHAQAAIGPWGGYSNGRIPLSALQKISYGSARYLRPDSANAFESLSSAFQGRFGSKIYITDAYRTYDQQVVLKQEKPYLAATPGRSNHGWALAVDLGSKINSFGTTEHNWMRANAGSFKWIHPSWAQQNGSKPEAWHWEYSGEITDSTPYKTTPEQRDNDMKLIQASNRGIAIVGPGYFRQLVNNEEVEQAQILYGAPVVGNDRQFDVWRSLAFQGQSSSH